MIRRPRDLTELACLYTTDDRPECRRYLGENTMQTVYRFAASGIEVSAEALNRKAAGDELARFARHVQKQRGMTFSQAMRLTTERHPMTTDAYLFG